jgi:hypothetical protein
MYCIGALCKVFWKYSIASWCWSSELCCHVDANVLEEYWFQLQVLMSSQHSRLTLTPILLQEPQISCNYVHCYEKHWRELCHYENVVLSWFILLQLSWIIIENYFWRMDVLGMRTPWTGSQLATRPLPTCRLSPHTCPCVEQARASGCSVEQSKTMHILNCMVTVICVQWPYNSIL